MKKVFTLFTLLVIAVTLGTFCSCTMGNLPGLLPGETEGEDEPEDGGYTGGEQEEPNPGDYETGSNAERMQTFIKGISAYARNLRPGFIIIPQNAEELAFNNAKPNGRLNASYIAAIDGIGVEELFYDGGSNPDNGRINTLRKLKDSAKIMVADYVKGDTAASLSFILNASEGFIAFPRRENNYDYEYIPDPSDLKNENAGDITKLEDAQNYLYLISDEQYKSSKDDMITAIAGTNYDAVIIDLFYGNRPFTSGDLERLKTKNNGGRRLVIAYISVGSAENYRYYWQDGWKKGSPAFLKKNYDGFPDEFWVEYWDPQWRNIIYGNDNSYMKKIIDAGFDGAYLDNVEAYNILEE